MKIKECPFCGKTMFIVGQLVAASKTWMAEGLFVTEKMAVKNCKKKNWFVIEVAVDKMFPAKAINAINLWWPNKETKQGSKLYKSRLRKK